MELAKKPVRFLCNGDANTFKITVPKTEHSYLFFRDQPYLVKFDLDIEFFREHDFFDEVETQGARDLPGVPNNITEEEAKKADAESKDSEPEKEKESVPEEDGEKGICNIEGCGNEVDHPGDSCKEHPKSEPEEKKKSKKELQEMRKTDLRELLEKVSPGKTCPVRKSNIINLILEVQ